MATGALRGRTAIAAALLVAALAMLLGAWFVAGWSDVRARQAEARTAPTGAAARRSAELARDLRAELDALVGREIERPYFQYQNLFRDPRASASVAVAPSPLATERDPLVLGYFQIDEKGKVTTPTVNDDVPELSEPTGLAGNLAFRDDVATSLGAIYRPPARATTTVVAQADPRPRVPRPRPQAPATPPPTNATTNAVTPPDAGAAETFETPGGSRNVSQVQTIDNVSYQQNWNSNTIYLENNPRGGSIPSSDTASIPSLPTVATVTPPVTPPDVPPDAGVTGVATDEPGAGTKTANQTPPPTTPRTPRTTPRVVSTKIEKLDNKPVTIVVSAFALETETFRGAPALVATRLVETPDGALAQGFVIDPAQIARWLTARDEGAAIVHRDAPLDREALVSSALVVPDWFVEVRPPAVVLANAAASAAKLATTFLVRFVALGALAALAAALVVLMVARAERLARERSQFAAAAAHELRTPLAGLQLYGDMLADGMGDPGKQRDYARRMAEEAARLGRVVSNVLGFSQLERGNLSVNPTAGDVAAELAELAARAEPALDRAGAVLALEVAPELRASFDRDALARIVGNLLDNAEKYSREAEDRTITLAARAAAVGGVEIEVSDHGPGVAAATRGKLFAPFQRGVSSDGPAGLGLGLALSQSLAKAMGGSLEYLPSSGVGARFVLRLAPA